MGRSVLYSSTRWLPLGENSHQDPETQRIVVLGSISSTIRLGHPKVWRNDEPKAEVEETKSSEHSVRISVTQDELPIRRHHLLERKSAYGDSHSHCDALLRTIPIPATAKKFPIKALVVPTPRKPISANESVVNVVEKAPMAKAVGLPICDLMVIGTGM